ncbi:MAG TPA: tetratricopeptide repeat protein [Pyrinomonadaceae bacterium]|nr:tetratricopeptide repeat protein [Pyrinomonadaceae bacterium]
MPLQIVPVFISSTWLDLRPEREAVERALQRLRETKFVGMEYFGSRDETTRRSSLDEVDRSRVYVGIFAARYGSGITEEEYRRARSRGLPCLVYFKDDAAVPGDLRETNPARAAKLEALKADLRREHGVSTFASPDDLAARVTADLHNWLFQEYLTPILERAARGELPFGDVRVLLSGVKDKSALNQSLLLQLTARHQLRAPVGDFVGREKEIEQLLAALRGGASAAITGISGMGGIGKTELAYYVAERLRDTYPDAQLVLDMRGTDDPPRDPADALAACIRAFHGLEQRLPDDAALLTDIYRSTLEGKRALILLDNASDSAQVRPLLPPVGSALLITSRNAIALPGMRRTTLGQLEPSEARELLDGIAPGVPAETADQICSLCGYLPLAVRAAASLLAVTDDLDPADYAARLREERTRLELIGTDPLIGLDVTASFNLSYAHLTSDAARVFRQLAVFPATFDARAEEAVCEDPGHKHLTDLLRRNLVIYNPDTRRYRLHDLARLFADSQLSVEERGAGERRYAGHYLTVLAECDKLYLQGGEGVKSGLARYDAERQNVETGQAWACLHSGADEAVARQCSSYPLVGVNVLDLRQHPREDILWLEAGLAAARRLNDRTAEARHLGNLGVTCAVLGETRRAIDYCEQALVVLREVGDRSGESRVLGNLGISYKNLGETHRAIELYEQRLAIARELGDRRGEAVALSSLGNAYLRLDEVRRSIEFHEQALAISREIGDRRGEGQDLGNLGSAYAALGETHRALEFYEKRLAIARELGDRRGEGDVLFNIGVELDKLGDRAKALAQAEAALEILERIESPGVETVRARLAEWRAEATGGE